MILALKTATMESEIYLYENGQLVQKELWQSGRELSEGLLTHIEALIKKPAKSFQDLTGIIVYHGPGSFTSLRIGLTVANTIAYAQTIPIVGTSEDDWINQGLHKLKSAKPGSYVMPAYGAEANITTPRK